MRSVVPRESSAMDTNAAQAWDRAMALTIGQLQPRQAHEAAEPAEALPVAETQEIDWDEWCAVTATPVGQIPTQRTSAG